MAATVIKSLFFIFILLGLLILTKIWIEKVLQEEPKENLENLAKLENMREKIKEALQNSQQRLDNLEANYKTAIGKLSDAIDEHLRGMDPMIAQAKQAAEKLPQDFTQLGRFLQSLKGLLESIRGFVDIAKMEKNKQIEETQQKLSAINNEFELFEKKRSEL